MVTEMPKIKARELRVCTHAALRSWKESVRDINTLIASRNYTTDEIQLALHSLYQRIQRFETFIDEDTP